MKKYAGIMLLMISMLLMSLALVGCQEQDQEGTPVDIMYLDKSETKVVAEQHYLESTDVKGKIVEVLTLLCSLPENKELKATLSGGINIINYSFEGTQVTVSLGDKYKELSKTTEILTRAAVVKSLIQIADVEYVMLTVGGEPILDAAGNGVGIMSAETFVDNTEGQMNDYEQVIIRLYFANEEGNQLIPINRSLVHNINSSNVSMERLVIEQILKGPVNDESFPTVNPDTKILGITVTDGTCYINVDSSILTPVNNVTSDVTIYSIVNSLVELSNINKVQISIDGRKDIKFKDKYDLSTVFERNLQLVVN